MTNAKALEVFKDLKKQNNFSYQGSADSDDEALEATPEKLKEYALRTARRLLVRWPNLPFDMDEDLCQQALERYYKLDEDSRKNIINLKAYLYRVIKNLITDYIRVQHPASLVQSDSTEYAEPKAPDESRTVEFVILLREVWSRLKDDERHLLELMIHDYSSKELALRLEISEEAARQRTSRLRSKLEGLLIQS
jgi:RNA polymerase sigma factor (sigma-70 family)